MFLHTPAVRAGEGTWQQTVLLAVHDPALVQGLGQGPGLGPGVGSEQGQEPGLDQPPQSQPQSQLQLQHIELSLARQLRAVWISHPHADHHLGLLRVLSERRRWLVMAGCFTPLVVIAPFSVLAFLRDVAVVRDSDYPLASPHNRTSTASPSP